MPSDRAISATRFDGGTVVQAFPLGGRVRNVPLSAEVPQPLSLVSTPPSDVSEISAKASVIMLRVPPGRTLSHLTERSMEGNTLTPGAFRGRG